MTSDHIVGIDLGTTNSLVAFMQGEMPVVIPSEDGLDQEIRILKVQKSLNADDQSWGVDARSVQQDIETRIGRLHREINGCRDGEHEADLWERYYRNKEHLQKVSALFES